VLTLPLMGSWNRPERDRRAVPKPPTSPTPTAAAVFASAKGNPSVPMVRKNMDGSMSGEASQKAMTAARGTPMPSSAAIKGMTPHEQNGERPPIKAARMIMGTRLPENARAMMLSAPLALA